MEQEKELKKLINEETVNKAIEKVNTDSRLTVEGYEYVIIREDSYDEIIKMFRDDYFPDETTSQSICLSLNDEIKDIILTQMKQSLSVAIASLETGKVVSWLIVTVVGKFDKIYAEEEKNRDWFSIIGHAEEESNVFRKYTVEEAIYFAYLCTGRGFRGNGLGTKVMEATINLLKNLGLEDCVIFGEGSSKTSQRVFEKCGFEPIYEILYSDFKVNGETVFKNTGGDTTYKLYTQVV